MEQALSIIVLVAICAALLLVVVLISVRFMAALFKRHSGYARLASLYPAGDLARGELRPGSEEPPADGGAIASGDRAAGAGDDRRLTRQTVQFGAVRYTRCVTVASLDEGLFLQVVSLALGRHRAIVVPWGEIRATAFATIRLRDAVELVVGERRPVGVRVLPDTYASLRSRLVAAVPLVEVEGSRRP